MAKKNLTAGDRQILLTEYQVCQHDINASNNSNWVAFGIFFTANFLALGWIASNIITIKNTENFNMYIGQHLGWLLFITVVGIGAIIILIFLLFWLKRVGYLMHVKQYRMREIEDLTGMQTNLIIHGFDFKNKEPDKQKKVLGGITYAKKPGEYVKGIYYIIISFWIVAILVIWLLPLLFNIFK